MNERSDDIRTMLEAYLDGRLDDAGRRAVEEMLQRDRAAQSDVTLGRKIEDRMRRVFAPPEPVALCRQGAGVATPATRGPDRFVPRRAWVWGSAAAILLVALGVFAWAWLRTPSPQQLYEDLLDEGFTPEWICGDDAKFAAFVAERFGESFLLAPAEKVKVVGWTYADDVLSEDTAALMAMVADVAVILLIDRRSADRQLELPTDGKLHLHRRELGSLVLYEVTPHDQPTLLRCAYQPKP